jgi:hypothetical protein
MKKRSPELLAKMAGFVDGRCVRLDKCAWSAARSESLSKLKNVEWPLGFPWTAEARGEYIDEHTKQCKKFGGLDVCKV